MVGRLSVGEQRPTMQQPALQRPEAARCPWHAQAALDTHDTGAERLRPDTRLVLPRHKRMVTQRFTDPVSGAHELRLFYGDKEISFDEPELFGFGETLARQSRFAAGEAVAWGEPGGWPKVRALLEQLIEAEVLQLADDGQPDERAPGDTGLRPSPLPPASTDSARDWHELPGLMTELAGRPLEIGYLELVVPIFRVAHMAMDGEGRQVGESNAFPAALRVDVPTRWRSCIYEGSRHQDAKPMNVSALKAMRAHWGPMMALLLKLREAYLRRCPDADPARGGWTVGHLERLSTAVLALPALQLMRRDERVANGALHPVLSSLFRVTDGLRMTMHHMLFIPFGEPTRKPDTPMSGPEVYAYAERAFSLHSEHGVCAGPRAMIEEFLAVLVEGQQPRDGLPATLAPELQSALADIEPAIDYAMLGLQAYAAVFSLWPLTMRAYEQLHGIAVGWAAGEPSLAVQGLVAWLQPIVHRLRTATHLATEAWRADREFVYDDMYTQAGRCRSGQPPRHSLAGQLAPGRIAADAAPVASLRAAIARRFGAGATPAQVQWRDAWLNGLVQYFLQAQAVVRAACAVQAQTNRLLGRETPTRPFAVADIDLYVQLVGMTQGRVPFLLDELSTTFGLQVDIDSDSLTVTDTHTEAPA